MQYYIEVKEIFKKMREFSLHRNIQSLCKLTSVVFNLSPYSMQLSRLKGAQRINNDAIGSAKYDVILKSQLAVCGKNCVIKLIFYAVCATNKRKYTYWYQTASTESFWYYKCIKSTFFGQVSNNNDTNARKSFLSRTTILNSNPR